MQANVIGNRMMILGACAVVLLLGAVDAASAVTLSVVADYQDDFNVGTSVGQPGGFGAFDNGWGYYWNAPTGWVPDSSGGAGGTGPIGVEAEYDVMLWSGIRWTPDGDELQSNDDPPANFANLGANSGHPGIGSAQDGGVGNSLDRYVIAGYTVSADGEYSLIDSSISRGSGGTTGHDIEVYVNDTQVFATTLGISSSTTFDTPLGMLSAGDRVYVAVGPNANGASDGFNDFDFSLAVAVPEPGTGALLLLGMLGLVARRRRR